jgi:hypothetical protein
MNTNTTNSNKPVGNAPTTPAANANAKATPKT